MMSHSRGCDLQSHTVGTQNFVSPPPHACRKTVRAMRDIIVFTYGGSFPDKICQIKCYIYACKRNFVTGSWGGGYKVQHTGNSTKTSFYDYIYIYIRPFSVWSVATILLVFA